VFNSKANNMGKKNHIVDALKSIAAAQAELQKTVATHSKIINSQGRDIANLEQKVMEFRNNAIQAEVANGVPSKEVALKYNLTPARVAHIAPRTLN
jgi:DNA-binding NarL/FixJ family response regulator